MNIAVSCSKVGNDTYTGSPVYRIIISEPFLITYYTDKTVRSVKAYSSCIYEIFSAPNKKTASQFGLLLYKAGYLSGRYIYSKKKEKEVLAELLSKI